MRIFLNKTLSAKLIEIKEKTGDSTNRVLKNALEIYLKQLEEEVKAEND